MYQWGYDEADVAERNLRGVTAHPMRGGDVALHIGPNARRRDWLWLESALRLCDKHWHVRLRGRVTLWLLEWLDRISR